MAATITILVFLLAINGCRSKDPDNQDNAELNGQEESYKKSPLTTGQSHLLDDQVDSIVDWQSWHKDLFRQADNERRLVCALIGSGTDPDMLKVLATMNQSARLLNNNHLNTIIDTNLHPDIEYYIAIVGIISKIKMTTPMLVWFSYEGNLVSWVPIRSMRSNEIHTMIQRTSNTVHSMWLDSPEYTLSNSRRDQEKRGKLSTPRPLDSETNIIPSITRSISQARSLFDPVSDTVDALNKLTAARYIQLMTIASNLSEQSAKQQLQCLEIAKRVADNMLIYGLIDPLDGGVYTAYNGQGRSLPTFSKTLRAQALAMSALYQLYQSTQDTKYLNAGNRIKTFTEQYLTQEDGSLALGMTYVDDTPEDQSNFWTLEEIKELLSTEELDIAIDAFGLKALGNINHLDDTKKIYFRKNILSWKTTVEDLAKSKSISTKKITQQLESISSKLLANRSQKSNNSSLEELETSASLALYASACISGYRASSDTSHLASAEKTLRHLRDHYFAADNQLQHSSYKGRLNGIPAKGTDYALVCQAALDLNEVTLDPEWLQFAYRVHKQMNKNLRNPKTGFIIESGAALYPKAYPVYYAFNLSLIDNDSTWALAHSNAKRLSLQVNDDLLDEQVTQLEGLVLQNSQLSAIASIDYLTREAMARSARCYIKPPIDDAMLTMVRNNPCQIVALSESGTYPELGSEASEIKAGSCVLLVNGKRIGQASSLTQLKSLFKKGR